MDLLLTVIILLTCLLISNIISHYIPAIPTALTQIAFGIILALVVRDMSFEIETEWFLLLFVAPLLFNDGRHFPREELWRMRAPIFGNAIVLVLLTTIGGGYLIRWIIPDIPLAAAFALAAILSPTDPVAVNGIAKRIHLPERVLNLVRGESLINDASGLVAFNYAVAAVVTGYFSLSEAIFDFIYMFIAGALLGLILGLLIFWFRYTLRKQGIIDVTFHTLLQVLTPFIIFIITEELLHASGVIAVVVAGFVHTLVSERTETMMAEEKIVTENVWSIVLFILNGIVFILLGLNIPSSMRETVENPNIGNWLAIGYVIAIGIIIFAIRFIWSYFFSHYQYRFGKNNGMEKPDIITCLLVTLTGVRGAVTMAGVLSIPYFLMNGAFFPQRSLILFLAAGVILFTLIVATLFLPMLSKEKAITGDQQNMNLSTARAKILQETLKQIRQEMNDDNELAAYELMDEYKLMFTKFHPQQNSETEKHQKQVAEIRLIGLKAERKYIQEVFQNNQMDQEVYEIFEKALDHREEVLSNNVRTGTIFILGKALRGWKRFNGKARKEQEANFDKLRKGKDIQLKAIQNAIDTLERHVVNDENPDIVHAVILDYKRIMKRIRTPRLHFDERKEEKKEELRLKVMDAERSEIHRMYEAGEITSEQAKELRRFINYIESVTLYEHSE
ncbi:Na+/H+ antiporter [Caldibacillus lycopersici]|uniref:Na+/H+ antiporter n=1 Tax=Perspicuibacillus lycopersici TaxID=1325689 RepID=A0AAE3LQF0_9BACI|nr:Na+/H+ antiporter [Perspicuibacillus lycopersici]MCU9613419.1 Na+/H+ antiporter [Perspicuibacillus lycopersici]